MASVFSHMGFEQRRSSSHNFSDIHKAIGVGPIVAEGCGGAYTGRHWARRPKSMRWWVLAGFGQRRGRLDDHRSTILFRSQSRRWKGCKSTFSPDAGQTLSFIPPGIAQLALSSGRRHGRPSMVRPPKGWPTLLSPVFLVLRHQPHVFVRILGASLCRLGASLCMLSGWRVAWCMGCPPGGDRQSGRPLKFLGCSGVSESMRRSTDGCRLGAGAHRFVVATAICGHRRPSPSGQQPSELQMSRRSASLVGQARQCAAGRRRAARWSSHLRATSDSLDTGA